MTATLGRHVFGTAAALALLFGMTPHASAFGTPTYIIYVDGPFGGTIEASNGAQPLPDGACGMQLLSNNVLAWYWAGGEVFPGAELNIDNNGWQPPANQLTELIEFTGPFGDDCDGEYVFHTPATPGAEPPPGAVALIVQFVDPDDVVFLTWNFQVWEVEDPPPPTDPPDGEGDICEEIPEFCEIPGSFVEDPCSSSFWGELCDDAEEVSKLGFTVGRIVEPLVLGLTGLNGTSADGPVLAAALKRVLTAQAYGPFIGGVRVALQRSAGTRLTGRAAQRSMAEALVGAELGVRELSQCHADLEATQRLTSASTSRASKAAIEQGRRAKATCTAASATLLHIQDAATGLKIALRGER